MADDPQFARQIGWNLLLIALSAGILAAGAAFWVVRRITLPLRRLSETMSGMARTGELQSDFPTAGGGGEVQLIEETFRGLVVSLEESQRARERSYVEAVGAVVTAADARDHETSGHSFRVALYAVALAKADGPRTASSSRRSSGGPSSTTWARWSCRTRSCARWGRSPTRSGTS